jgi:HK97 family phage major capsid protein
MVRVLTDPTAYWRGEGIAITESDATFGALLVTPGSLGALCRVNAELLDDVPTFAATLDNMLAQALALKLDLLGLYGSGVGAESTGLRNISTGDGINEVSMGTNGAAAADYDDYWTCSRRSRKTTGRRRRSSTRRARASSCKNL